MTWITDCREFRRKMLVGLRWQHAGRRRQDENFTSDEGGRNGEEERYQEDEEEREREIDPLTLQSFIQPVAARESRASPWAAIWPIVALMFKWRAAF